MAGFDSEDNGCFCSLPRSPDSSPLTNPGLFIAFDEVPTDFAVAQLHIGFPFLVKFMHVGIANELF